MNWSFIVFVVSVSEAVLGNDIKTKVRQYFNSDTVKSAQKIWDKYQTSFENTLIIALNNGFGRKSMNVYINRFGNVMDIARGYYHNDNEVQILLANLGLTELPNIYDSEITFNLPSNMLNLELSVGRMIVYGQYIVFRNSSDIIYASVDQNTYKNSPFRFQQVAYSGDIAISAEGCELSGYAVVTLSGSTVNVGHYAFQLKDCHYNLEIFEINLNGGPPVIANYAFGKGLEITLDKLILRPLMEDLTPKLQAALFSYVNTSSLFNSQLNKIREVQENLMEDVKRFEYAMVRCMNKHTMQDKDMGTVALCDFELKIGDKVHYPHADELVLSDVKLLGFDTLYSSQMGGPVLGPNLKYAQQLRYKTLQVTGKIGKATDKFAVEISDLMVNVEAYESLELNYDVIGWRNVEFSSSIEEPSPAEVFVIAYLQHEIPKHIISHLRSVFNACKMF